MSQPQPLTVSQRAPSILRLEMKARNVLWTRCIERSDWSCAQAQLRDVAFVAGDRVNINGRGLEVEILSKGICRRKTAWLSGGGVAIT